MYSVSAAYSEAIAKQSRHFRLSGDILLQSRTKIDITDRNILGDMNIESVMMSGSSSEDIIDIGAVVSSKLTMKIHDSSTSDSFADAMVRPIVGLETSADVYEDIPMGIFYVNAASIQRVKDQISFAAYDKMIFMQYILTEDMRSAISVMKPYGATAYLAAFVGIPMAQEQAVVDAFPNGDIILSGATDKRIETARDLIMWCAQMMGCYVRINRSGRLEYVQIKAEISADTGMIIPVREIAASQRNDTKFADGVLRISSLIMKKADGTPTRAYLAETSSTKRSVELELEQNPLLIGEETRTVGEALKAILTVLKTAYFRPFSASIANDPALDAGDYVRLRGGNIDTTRGYATGMITHNSWHYSGGQDIVNVGAVPVISQLEDTAAAAEVAEVSEVAEGEECEDITGETLAYVQPRRQSEKLGESSGGSGGGTAEKLQTSGSAVYAVTRHNDKDALWIVNEDGTVTLNLALGASNGFSLMDNSGASVEFSGGNTINIQNRVSQIRVDDQQIWIQNSVARQIRSDSSFVLYAQGNNSQYQVGSDIFFSLNGSGLQILSRSNNISLALDSTGLYVNGKKVLTEE